jgi:hypothetical protein
MKRDLFPNPPVDARKRRFKNAQEPTGGLWVSPLSLLTGHVFTLPGSLNGDDQILQFSPNGGNDVSFILDNSILVDLGFLYDGMATIKCFNDPTYSGSFQLYDFTNSGRDSDLVGRFWFGAKTLNQNSAQYVIDLYDDGFGWVDSDGFKVEFPPAAIIDKPISRNVSHWEMRTTARNLRREACITNGIFPVSNSPTANQIDLWKVELCEHPDTAACTP